MQYSININQLVLADTTLDLLDSAILMYLRTAYTFTDSNAKRNGHAPLDCDDLIETLPLLRIKNVGSIIPRVNRIEENGFITIQKIKNELYFKPTPKVDTLFSDCQ